MVDDPNRAYPYYGLIGTAFAVLLAFVVLISFQSYNQGKSGAETEAVALTEMYRTGEFFPQGQREEFAGEVVCLGRASVAEWPAMSDSERNPDVDEWVSLLRETTASFDTLTPAQQAAFSHLLTEEDQRATGRRERLSEADPAVTPPVWFTLLLGGLTVILGTLVFADRRESFKVQAALMAGVTVMVVTGLSLVWFLDHPYRDASGSIQPVELRRSLEIMEASHRGLPIPCNEAGTPPVQPA